MEGGVYVGSVRVFIEGNSNRGELIVLRGGGLEGGGCGGGRDI